MFSLKQKQYIAAEIEKIILSVKHPEMPSSKPYFKIHIDGAENWSWADIEPNWVFDSKQPNINPWNENQDPLDWMGAERNV